MRAPHWNALVDGVAYVNFVALIATGLVLEYRLPPGSGGLHGGRGGRGSAGREVDLLWGFDRHQWGELHYGIALVLLAVLAVHLALHWKWIVAMLRGKKSGASGMRFGLGLAGLVGVVALGVLPFVTATDVTTRGALAPAPSSESDASASPPPALPSDSSEGADQKSQAFADLRGRNTLAEAAAAAGVSVDTLRREFNLPADTPATTRFSSFIHDQGLGMDEVRQTLARLATPRPAGEPVDGDPGD